MSRSSLLRETNRLASDILTLHASADALGAEFSRVSSEKAAAVAALTAADARVSAAERARAEEVANDGELRALQRAHSALSARLADSIAAVKRTRAERDRAREEALVGYYLRVGAEAEAEAASAAGVSGDVGAAPVWPPDALAALEAASALWRRVSNSATVARDMAEGALLARGKTLGADVAPSASILFGTGVLGPTAVAADTARALRETRELENEIEALRTRVAMVDAAPDALAAIVDALQEAIDAQLEMCGVAEKTLTQE